MITGIQFVAVSFSILMIYITYLHFKKNQLGSGEALFFGLVWVLSLIITILPSSANFILQSFRIYRVLDLATIVGFMFLAILVFKNYLELKDLRKRIKDITRNLSTKETKKR